MSEVADLEYRQCQSCVQDMPVDQFDGASAICRHCDKIKSREVRKHMRKVTSRVDTELLDHMQAFIARWKDRPVNADDELPNLGNVASVFLEAVGGPSGLALLTVAEYLNAKPGGSVRERHLSRIQKLQQQADAAGYTKRPLSHYSLEELEAEMAKAAPKVFRLTNAEDEDEETDVAAVAS